MTGYGSTQVQQECDSDHGLTIVMGVELEDPLARVGCAMSSAIWALPAQMQVTSTGQRDSSASVVNSREVRRPPTRFRRSR